MKNNIVKIQMVEACDIVKINEENQQINKKYKGAVVDSLLLDKLKELGLKVNTKSKTRDLVVVEFGCKFVPKEARELQNKVNLLKEKMTDNVKDRKSQQDKKIKGKGSRKANEPMKKEIERLKRENKENREDRKNLEQQINQIIASNGMDKRKLRHKIYKEGFWLDYYKQNRETKEWVAEERIEYVYFFRTPSKSKNGNAVFVNKKLFKTIDEWQRMGIELPKENSMLVELEAYKSLTSSAVENRIKIDPRTEILVLKDLDSFLECECAKVYLNEENHCEVEHGKMKIKNTLFDGMGLIDDSLFYNNAGMMVLRHHFCKLAGVKTFIQKFMKNWCKEHGLDYETATTKDMFGRTVYLKNIKLITTDNAMKWIKFDISYDYWCDRVEADNNIFGVVKTDHKSKWGALQRMSFQMVNSLPMEEDEAKELCKHSVEFVERIKKNNEKFIEFLEMTKSKFNSNQMFIDLYQCNKKIENTPIFRDFKTEKVHKLKQTLKSGKLLTNSDNQTVFGNPYSLLLYSVGALNKYITDRGTDRVIEGYEDETLPILDKESKEVSCYTTRFEDNELLAVFRSPHNSINNIGLYKVNKHNLLEKYFPISDNILFVNCLKTNIQDRMNGCDFDSDFFYVSRDKVLVESARKAQEFPTIVNAIPKENKLYPNNMSQLANIDFKLAEGQNDIGRSSNLSMLALSWYFKYETNKLLDICCILSVLAQIAIDSAKRKFDINVSKEIEYIELLPCMDLRVKNGLLVAEGDVQYSDKLKLAIPYSWQFIKNIKKKQVDKENCNDIEDYIIRLRKSNKNKEKAENRIKSKCIEEKICPMDYIQEPIDNIKNFNGTNKGITISNLDLVVDIQGKANTRRMNKVLNIVSEFNDFYKKYFDEKDKDNSRNYDDDDVLELVVKHDDILDELNSIKFNKDIKSMQMLIKNALNMNKENARFKRRLLNCLYQTNKTLFLKCWIQNAE